MGGILLAAIQLRRIRGVSAVVRIFVVVTRGTPVLLQLLFVYDVLPTQGIRLNAFFTAVLVLGVNTSSYFSEVIRGAVAAVPRGQVVAAASLGMSPFVIARRIVFPQAGRIALPSLANQVVVLILTSSLASVISVSELTLRSQEISAATFQVISVFSAAGVMYLVLTSAVAAIEILLERLLAPDVVPGEQALVKRWGHKVRRIAFDSAALLAPRRLGVPAWAARAEARTAAVTLGGPGGESLEELALSEQDVHLDHALLAQGSSGNNGSAGTGSAASAPMLDVRDLVKSYGNAKVLQGVSLTVDRGEVVAIMGASGCGKSTLLRSILGLEDYESGSIRIDGRQFGVDEAGGRLRGRALARARARAHVSMVFQNFELFAHMNARDNVSAALRFVHGERREASSSRAHDLLAAVGLGEHLHHLPQHLSGGQQQRVAIARALAIEPRLILLDEPTSALDPLMVHEVLVVLRRLRSLGMTMLIVTHELEFAREVADRLVFMHAGSIVESGTPERVLTAPTHSVTRTFLRILEK